MSFTENPLELPTAETVKTCPTVNPLTSDTVAVATFVATSKSETLTVDCWVNAPLEANEKLGDVLILFAAISNSSAGLPTDCFCVSS